MWLKVQMKNFRRRILQRKGMRSRGLEILILFVVKTVPFAGCVCRDEGQEFGPLDLKWTVIGRWVRAWALLQICRFLLHWVCVEAISNGRMGLGRNFNLAIRPWTRKVKRKEIRKKIRCNIHTFFFKKKFWGGIQPEIDYHNLNKL